MVKWFILGAFIIALIWAIFWLIKFYIGSKALVETFSDGNVITYGKKGSGKDVINNKVINARKEPCYANIPFNKEYCVEKDIKEFSVEPNTFEDILENRVKVIKKNNKEKCDYYISDGGIFLPSQYSNRLIKDYPSLPIYYALSRHLTNSNIHINTQYLGRVWDKLREQSAYYVRAIKTRKFLVFKYDPEKEKQTKWDRIKIYITKHIGFLVTEFIIYDNYASAMSELRPYKATGLITHSESRANREDFEAKHGSVKRYFIAQYVRHIYYDTRHFHRRFYGYNSPDSI